MYNMSKSKHQWIAGVASLGTGQDEEILQVLNTA